MVNNISSRIKLLLTKITLPKIFTLALVVVCCILLPVGQAQGIGKTKRILYLSSYSYAWGSVPFQIKGLTEGLEGQYIVNYEFMDTKNTVYSDKYLEFYHMLKYKMRNREPYDGVVLCDDAALNFVMLYRKELFPDIPIVFEGIDNSVNGYAAARKDSRITGVLEIVDYKANLELAHKLFPKAKKVVFILDNMESGIGIAQQLTDANRSFANYNVEYLNSSQHTQEELCEHLKAVDDDNIFFCISMGQQKDGRVYTDEERYAMIRKYSHVPMFRFTQSGVGNGLLGGYIVDHEACTKLAAIMLREILEKGTVPAVVSATPGKYYFDYNVMKKYNIPVEELEKFTNNKADIINKPVGFLQKNALTIVIILIGTLLVMALIFTYKLQKAFQAKSKFLAEAKKANMAKTEFLSRISHDMRTPMNGILGMTVLSKDETDLNVIRENLKQIELSGKYLLNLINDTLDVNRIEMGKLELHPKKVPANEVYANVIVNTKVLAENKKVNFKYKTTGIDLSSEILIYVDQLRIEQMLINALSNAVKFTPAGGNVEFIRHITNMTDKEFSINYTISDTGIGMSQEFIKNIFKPFAQEGRINLEREQGTGLGMSIVQQLVNLMHGDIKITSLVGQGTVVNISINVPYFKETNVKLKNTELDYTKLAGKKVLLCEDHPINAKIAKRLLEKKQLSVETAQDGEEACDKFARSAIGYYDFILMDIRMPKLNGYETTKAIRTMNRADAAKIPIIAMTANAFVEDANACLEAGMNAHISKPVEPKVLYNTLASFC